MGTIRDRLWSKAAREKIPLTAAFELLPVCNLSCKMCYVRKSMKEVRERGGLIEGGQWLEWAEEAGKLGLLFPLLTGGEPFLHPDFQEIYSGMANRGMQVSINTNGTLIDERTAAWLGEMPPTRINITLYGASEASYENLCGDGDAYRKVRNAVQWLKKYRIPVKFNTSITAYNIQDLEALIRYADEMEIPIQTAAYMFPPIRRDERMVGRNDRLTPEKAALARVKADFLRSEPEWFLGQAERYRGFVPVDRLKDGKRKIQRMNCRAGNSSAWLSWEGNLTNCGMYNSVTVSLREKPFGQAWKELTEQTAEITYQSFCSICPNQSLCHSCIAMIKNESGTVDGRPDYLCRMNEAAAKYYQEYAATISDSFQLPYDFLEDTVPNCDIDEF